MSDLMLRAACDMDGAIVPLPQVFRLLPSTKSRLQSVFNIAAVAIGAAVATAIQWLVLVVLAILMDMAVSGLIRRVGFAPDVEEVVLYIPNIYVVVLVVGITIKSTLDAIAALFKSDRWGDTEAKR